MKILLLLLILPCLADESSEQHLVEQMTTYEMQMERLDENRRELEKRRSELSQELSQLSARIEEEKKHQLLQGLVPNVALEADLRRAKKISEEIEQLSRSLAELASTRQQLAKKLVTVLEKLIELKLTLLPNRQREEKNREMALIEKLRQHHAQILHQISDTPEVSLPPLQPSDDLEELREQLDAVADAMDKLRLRLKWLEEAISRSRTQLKLERRLRQFVSDQELFAESRHEPVDTATSPKAGGSNETAPGDYQDGTLGNFPGRDSEAVVGPDPRINVPEVEATVTSTQERIQALEAEHQRLTEELKNLQIQYRRLQEKLENLQ